MKKIIFFLAIMSLTICKAQLATAPLQSAGNATAVANYTTNQAIKLNTDTLVQCTSTFVTTTITVVHTTTTTVVGNEIYTSSVTAGNCFSVAIPKGNWQVTGVVIASTYWQGATVFFMKENVNSGPNNTLTSATYAIMHKCIGFITVSVPNSALNGYIGSYSAGGYTSVIPVKDVIFYKMSYTTAASQANPSWIVTFQLKRV